MRKSYIFVYDDSAGDREQMTGFLDSMPEILNWRYELPYSFYLVSELSASEIATKIRKKRGEADWNFIVSELTANKQGWLHKKSWSLINKKHLPGEE